MFKFLVGQEKAIVGAISAGLLALLSQVGINSQVTVKEGVFAGVTAVVTHVMVWLTTNTNKGV